MKWRKHGLIYAPTGELWWAQSHAHLPTVDIIDESVIRVYFASLDNNKYGRIGYVDLDIRDPNRILYVSKEPILSVGELGTFDDCGTVPSCVVTLNNMKYMYYVGFQRTERVPYMLFTGLSTSPVNSLEFKRFSRTPILDRSKEEPFSRSAAYVIFDDNMFKMWYWSCVEWTQADNLTHYNNVIRYATSRDGIYWQTHPHICIEPRFPDEYSIGRPCVIKEQRVYKMWYSIRSFSKLYAIGYAESSDGIHWERKDNEAGIETSQTGWDSEMICYPVVVDINGKKHMFFNGNRHGATGFGFATQEA